LLWRDPIHLCSGHINYRQLLKLVNCQQHWFGIAHAQREKGLAFHSDQAGDLGGGVPDQEFAADSGKRLSFSFALEISSESGRFIGQSTVFVVE
jgi:hypothetical protein